MQYDRLEQLYLKKKLSAAQIANMDRCSESKVHYWLNKHRIPKRSISAAIYVKHNPGGDPFKINSPKNLSEAILYGLGLGLYWGEGTKSNKSSIRLGNTNPKIIVKFIEFLVMAYGIKRNKLKFGLQIFSDMGPKQAMKYWLNALDVSPSQFQRIVVTPARSIGTYKNKTKYGVLTVYYHNKKLRDILCSALERL